MCIRDRLQAAQGGAAQTGAMKISGSGSTTVTQNAATNTIDVSSVYVDTITRLRATSGQAYASGDFTFLATGATTVAQGIDGNNDPTITFDSTNTVTRVKGGTAGTLVSGDVNILGGTNVTVTQAGNDVTIASQDNDTVTRLASGSNAVTAGDFKIAAAGASTVTQATVGGVTTITVSSVNSDTGASLTASNGVLLSGLDFQLKNAANLKVLKGYGTMYKVAMAKAKKSSPAIYQHVKTLYEEKLTQLQNGKEQNAQSDNLSLIHI